MRYMEKRENFYAPIRENFWPELYGQEYSLYNYHTLSREEVEELRLKTKRIGVIYDKVGEFLRENADDETLTKALDIPESALNYVRLKTLSRPFVIARGDWIKTPQGYKMVELNAETPTFIKELFRINTLICDEFGVENPNAGMEEHLGKSITKSVEEALNWLENKPENPYIVFTAHGDHKEDWYTTEFLLEISKINGVMVELDDLRIDGEGLYDKEGRKIDLLYKQTYPTEHAILDENEKGEKVGEQLLQLVEEKKLAVLNPPSAFLLQSKAVQAVIWHFYENDVLFNEEEKIWIEEAMLPTYLDDEMFLSKNEKFVKKPSFGREGDTIDIYQGKTLIEQEVERSYIKSTPVYQRFANLPTVDVETSFGKENLYSLMGCFLINGEPSAMGLRVDTKLITGNMSYFLPVAYND